MNKKQMQKARELIKTNKLSGNYDQTFSHNYKLLNLFDEAGSGLYFERIARHKI